MIIIVFFGNVYISNKLNVCITNYVCELDRRLDNKYFPRMDTETLYRNIGTLIKRRRKQLRMTQDRLSKLVGLSRASVANVELGRQKILIHQIYLLAEHLEIAVVDLLPTAVSDHDTDQSQAFPLPTGLNRTQQEQLLRLLTGATSDALTNSTAKVSTNE
jgi:transcriptional regulator with XRE-family HTH domain